MHVKQIMAIGAVTVEQQDSVAKAAQLMKLQNVGMLVVMGPAGPQGVVTDRDLLTGCVGHGDNPKTCVVGDHTSEGFISTEPERDALEAARTMRRERIRRLPVMDKDELVGVVSFSDIARSLNAAMADVLVGMSTPAHVSAVTLAGRVSHYYTHLGVAAIQVGQPIRVGDMIYITGPTTNLEQTVESMELDRAQVEMAMTGQNVGIKVVGRVRTGDSVYVATEVGGNVMESMAGRYATVG
jgi:CBS domain-containing protein